MQSVNRTVPDDGYVLCYDCGGSGLCTLCDGDGTVDGKLCGLCIGRRYCRYCKGTGQVRPFFFPGEKKSELVARSADECRLYIELNPHELDRCNEREFPARARVEKTDRGLVAVYEAECPRCHKPRRLEFLLAPELPPPAPAFGGSTPSAIIDPGEFVHAANEAAKRAPSALAPSLADDQLQFAREKAAVSVAAIEEVFKFIPADKNAPPASAFKSAIGTELFSKDPDRFTRSQLQERLDHYRSVLAAFERELAKRAGSTNVASSKPAHLTAEDQAAVDQMLANRDKRRQQESEHGRKPPLPADSPIFKKWETDGFLEDTGDSAAEAEPKPLPHDEGAAALVKLLADPNPRQRVGALRSITASGFPDERVLAACEGLLDDRAITLLGIPYNYGEVRWVAAEAVAAVRKALGRPAPVVIEDAFAPVTSVRPLATAAGIEMERGDSGIDASIKTLEKLAAMGKLPRRKITR